MTRAHTIPLYPWHPAFSREHNADVFPPPQAVILAGPNGAGKTTASRGLLPPGVEYVNADIIAQRLSGRSDAPGELEAMRIEIAEIKRLVEARESFAVETTLAPRAFEKRIVQRRAAGYEVTLFFVYLADAEQSVRRVRKRFLHGGHDVPEEIVRRRYDEGLRNFFQKYRWSVDEWQFLDNSDVRTRLVASASIIE